MPAKIYLAATVLLLILCGHANAQERWAAITPNLENSSTVVWATSKEQAKKLATLACKQVSSTCAETPASTDGMDQMFAIMCCEEPKSGCAAAVGSDRELGAEGGQEAVLGRRLLPVHLEELLQGRDRREGLARPPCNGPDSCAIRRVRAALPAPYPRMRA